MDTTACGRARSGSTAASTTTPTPRSSGRAAFSITDYIARVTFDGQDGWGIFEHASLGPPRPVGLHRLHRAARRDRAAPLRWQVGAATVTSLVEACTDGIPAGFLLVDATADDIAACDWLADDQARPDGTVSMGVQAFLVEMPSYTVLVDPCVGNGKPRMLPFWNQLDLPWLDQLRATRRRAGSRRHGGAHAPARRPRRLGHPARRRRLAADLHERAPRLHGRGARVLRRDTADPAGEAYEDSVAPVVAAGLADLVEIDADLGHGLQLVPTPGHTPGTSRSRSRPATS